MKRWWGARGFSLVEVLVALVFVAIIGFLVASLGKQVMNIAKSGRQVSAVLGITSKQNSITQNPSGWMAALRGSTITQGIFAGCMPDTVSPGTTFNCPAVDPSITTSSSTNYDKEVSDIANGRVASYVPLVDSTKMQIAGTPSDPFYLDNDGKECTKSLPDKNCPFKSTGFMLRELSSAATDVNPGKEVSMVVKVERNLASLATEGGTPMKPRYMSLDMSAWSTLSSGTCPTGTIKLGFNPDGSAYCVTTQTCTLPKIAAGVHSDGTPNCVDVPTCPAGSAVLDAHSNTLVCSTEYPCTAGLVFLGYQIGGAPICSSPTTQCASGQVLMGTSCVSVSTCTLPNVMTFNGTAFVCDAPVSLAATCNPNEVVVGINANGSPQCQAKSAITCPSDQVMTGIKSDGTPNCVDRGLASSVSLTCPDGQMMYGLNPDGSVKCKVLSAGSSGISVTVPPHAVVNATGVTYMINGVTIGPVDVVNGEVGSGQFIWAVYEFGLDKVCQDNGFAGGYTGACLADVRGKHTGGDTASGTIESNQFVVINGKTYTAVACVYGQVAYSPPTKIGCVH